MPVYLFYIIVQKLKDSIMFLMEQTSCKNLQLLHILNILYEIIPS